jgi:hypothetical protein
MGYGVMTMRVETACLDQPGPSAPMTKTSLVAHKSQAMCVREDWRVMRPRMVEKPAGAERGRGEIEIKQQEGEGEEKRIGLLCTFCEKACASCKRGSNTNQRLKPRYEASTRI